MSGTIADPSTYPAASSIGPDDEFLVAKAQAGQAFALNSVTPSVIAAFIATIIGTVQGVAGPAGSAGAPGSQIYTSATALANSVGNNGDYYINTSTGIMYGPKSGGVWPGSGFSFGGTGPQGPAGNAGATGATGARGSLWYVGSGNPSGISGALAYDEYLDAATGNVWTYSGTTWTETGNIRGPAGAAGTNGTNGSNANLATLPDESTLALTDFIAAVIGGTPAQIEVSNFLSAVGTNVSALSAAAAASATDTVITLQGGTALLQTLSAMWTYFATQVPTLLNGVVELTANTALNATVHNKKILVCSQPVTISVPVSFLGAGFTCQVINLSPGVVTLGSGITTSSGAQTIPAGQRADVTSYTYSGGSGYFAAISGGSGALTGAGLSVGTVSNSYATGSAIGIVGSVGPSGTAVQVAIGNSATVPPSSGWVNATVSGTGFTASITEGTVGTYYIWAQQTGNTAVQAVSGAVSVYTASVAISSAPSTGSTGFALSANGTVSPNGTAVQIGLSTSNTTPPSSWTNATVTAGTWSGSITPSSAGTFYLWAQQTSNSAITAVSGAITIVASAVTITSPPSTGTVGTVMNLAGTLAPSGAAVNVGLSTSNTVPPTSWTAATVSGTGWTAAITPSAAGTYYIWAELAADTAVTAVSGAVTISAGAGTVAFTYPPTAGQTGVDLSVFGTVSPSGSSVQVGWSTTNTTAPTSWTSMATNAGIWSGNIAGPGSAGTYYLWAEIVGQAGTAVVSGAVTIAAASGDISIAFQTGSPAFSAIGYTAFASTQTHGATGVVFQVETTSLSGSEVANLYLVSEVSATEPSSGGGALGAAGSGILGIYVDIPSSPGTYYIQIFRRASAGGTLEAWMATTAITVT